MRSVVNNCEPANSIINAFGGARSIARLLNISYNTPSFWRTETRIQTSGFLRGNNGYIPSKYWDRIISLGRERGLNVYIVIPDNKDIKPYLSINNQINK